MSDRNMRDKDAQSPKTKVSEIRDVREMEDELDLREDSSPQSGDAGAQDTPDEFSGGGSSNSAEARAATAEDELQAVRAERDRLYEAWLRISADFDNYRKRVERDRQEFRDYALESLLRQLIPVLDNFDRAVEALPADTPQAVVDGIQLIQKQLHDLLLKQGLSFIHANGETFDPYLHEAVATEIRTDVPHHQVLEEVLAGYKLGKRVLRPAMVKVSVRPQTESATGQSDADEDLP